jgi:hypothetical protein
MNGRMMGAVMGSVLALATLTGCSNNTNTRMNYKFDIRKVTIETEPAGAVVTQVGAMDGARTVLGTTPVRDQSVAVTTGAKFKSVSPGQMQQIISQVEMVHVRIEKPGYQPYEGNLSTEKGKVKAHSIKLESVPSATASTSK